MSISVRLKRLRESKRASLQTVADAVGASKAHIWELESGRSSNPSIDLVKKLAAYFEVTISSLIGEPNNDGGISDADAALFRAMEGLTVNDKQILKNLAEDLKKRKQDEP